MEVRQLSRMTGDSLQKHVPKGDSRRRDLLTEQSLSYIRIVARLAA